MFGSKQHRLDFEQIQGLVFSGYPKCGSARYVFLRVTDAAAARNWLREVATTVTFGETPSRSAALNVALTASGLSALGLDRESLETFPLEFQEGLAQADDAYRPRILGDVGGSAPSRWLWGGPNNTVDVLLMLFAGSDAGSRDPALDEAALDRQLDEYRRGFSGALTEVYCRSTLSLPDRREHFGFVDGISQPKIQGQKGGDRRDSVKPGEFILGYENEFGKVPNSPTAPRNAAHEKTGENGKNGEGRWDLGQNGTFLVVRQLEQDVQGFWQSMKESSRKAAGADDPALAEWLAAKCVGRWPNGAPLVKAPHRDDARYNGDNAFKYEGDPDGLACPIGAHIRKANPRDSLEPSAKDSLKATSRRRLLRRGRAYGPPLARDEREPERKERGLFFVCLNTNIRRQFEFVQQSWLNNEKFAGLYADQNPIVGDQLPGVGSAFTIPDSPLRWRLPNLQRFVEVRGGAYFFLPSRSALEFLTCS